LAFSNYFSTGETSPFIGQINVQISLGKNFYQHNVFIADISNEGILGMDFLAANNCDVHLSENRLCFKGESPIKGEVSPVAVTR
jgi:hypothetical protein